MKKLLASLLVIAMIFAAIGCAAAPAPEATEAPQTEQTPAAEPTVAPEATPVDYSQFKVALLLPGTINDNGWNSAGYNAVENLKTTYGVQTAYTENIAASDIEEFLRGYATQGFQMVVCHGSQYIDYILKVAPEFPDTKFLISYGDEDKSQAPNVACVGPIETGFLAGAVAAAVSTKGSVAILGGEESPSIKASVDLFEQGAKYMNPDVKVYTGYIGTLTDADKAKEMAKTVISEHDVDVIVGCANAAGMGVIQAADEAGIYALGFNSDQYNVAPDAVVVSILRNFNVMYDDVFQKIVNGTFEATLYPYGIAQGGTILSDWHGWDAKLPAESVQKIEQMFQDFKDGKVTVDR